MKRALRALLTRLGLRQSEPFTVTIMHPAPFMLGRVTYSK